MKSSFWKKLGVTAAVATAAIGLAACGSKSADTSKKHTITFMYRGAADDKAAYETAIKQYEKTHKNVKVKMIITSADQYATKLQPAISGNKVPDVFYIEQNNLMAYVNNGVLKDISPEIKKSKVNLKNLWSYGVKSYQYNGKVIGKGAHYGLPKDVGPMSLGYNVDMFKKAGIPLPDKDKPYTFDQFVAVCKKLTKDTNGDGKLDQWATGFNVNWSLQSFVWSNGGDWINKKGTKVTVNTPQFAQALQRFADLQNKYKVTPSTEQGQTLNTYQRWMKGQLAFFPVGPWDLATYNKLNFKYDLIPWPAQNTGKSATYVGSLGIGVSKKTKYAQDATDLAVYLSSNRDAQKELVKHLIQIPTLKDMAKDWVADKSIQPDNREEFLQIVEDYGRTMPAATTYNSEWYDQFFTDIQPVLDGKITAKKYVAQEQPKMQAKLDSALQQQKTASAQ